MGDTAVTVSFTALAVYQASRSPLPAGTAQPHTNTLDDDHHGMQTLIPLA